MSTGRSVERARHHYQDVDVVEGYDSWRYENRRGRRRNRRDLDAIGRALDEAARRGHPVRTALDLPSGTGRLVPLFRDRGIRGFGADISLAMMSRARKKYGRLRVLRCDASAIPMSDASVDAVLAIRFFFHLDGPARRQVLREMRRVSRRWLVLDLRHRYNLRWVSWHVRRRLGLLREVPFRYSREAMEHELRDAGLALVAAAPSRRYFGWLSDKWIVLAEKRED
ncbi:MAG TPA: class I SAM-dependent methyltransferase [Thermoanaerobaculia bacterium]